MERWTALTSREGVWRTRTARLIRGRWAVGGALGLLGVSAGFRAAPQVATRLLLVALALGVANLLHAALSHRLTFRRRRAFEYSVGFQLAVDVLILSWLIHCTGGFQSPFLALLVLPAMLAPLLLRTALAPVLVGFSLAVPLVLHGFGGGGWLDALPPEGSLPFFSYYPWLTLTLVVSTCCYVCLHVVQRLRGQERGLAETEQLLRQRVDALEEARRSQQRLHEEVGRLSQLPVIAELSEQLARALREPMGIVRARAEAIQLALDEPGSGEQVREDFAVLLRHLESVQRGLRGILAFLPPSAVRGEVDLELVARRELSRTEIAADRFRRASPEALPVLSGSHDEIELAAGLVLRVIAEHAPTGGRIGLRVQNGAGRPYARFSLRFALESGADPHGPARADRPATALRLAVLQQVVKKHGGTMECSLPHEGRGRLDIQWPVPQPARAPRR